MWLDGLRSSRCVFGIRVLCLLSLYGSLKPSSLLFISINVQTGKTTLLKVLAGDETVDEGELSIGSTVKFGYASQSRASLRDYNTVYEEISEGQHEIRLGDRMVPMRQYVAGFQFTGTAQQKYVSDLSGGERNRIHLAKMLKSDVNVLLLDGTDFVSCLILHVFFC